ncbi:MAG: hypothetical protein M1355_03085 [Patescibacteria group bacterium]|nr:hypothetical protein [Patescibacteria group bacterium]
MEEKGINVKRLFITLGLVLFTALTVGGGTYYVLTQNAKKEKEANDKEIQALQNQVDTLKKGSEKKTETPAASSTNSTTTPADETANWKSYSNSTYKFSIKYPENWSLNTGGTMPFDIKNGADYIFVNPYQSKSDYPSTVKTLQQYIQYSLVTPAPKNIQSVTMSGFDEVIKYQQLQNAFKNTIYSYALRKGDRILIFTYGAQDKNPSQDAIDIAEKMVNTLTIQ